MRSNEVATEGTKVLLRSTEVVLKVLRCYWEALRLFWRYWSATEKHWVCYWGYFGENDTHWCWYRGDTDKLRLLLRVLRWYWHTLRCNMYWLLCFMSVINLMFDWLHIDTFLVIPSCSSCAPSDDSVLSLLFPFPLPPTENILIVESSALPKEIRHKQNSWLKSQG